MPEHTLWCRGEKSRPTTNPVSVVSEAIEEPYTINFYSMFDGSVTMF